MSYTVKGLPWEHGIGADVTNCNTAAEVLEKAGLDFFVNKCELVARMPFMINGDNSVNDTMGDFAYRGNIYRDCPNAFATYRTDKNIPLGIVKSKYEVVQNYDAFQFFDDAIGVDKAQWQRAGKYGYGHKVFITAKLPIETTVEGDPINNYLVFSNSHDGSASLTIMFTPIRVFCTNCLQAGLESSSSFIRIKHTKTAQEKLQRGAELLRIACEHAKDSAELYAALRHINMDDYQVKRYIANLILTDEEKVRLFEYDRNFGYDKLLARNYLCLEATGISTRKANQIAAIWDYYHNGVAQEEIVGTAWGAYNSITGYYSNVVDNTGEKRMDNLLIGTGNTVMLRAMNEAMAWAS